MAGGGTAPPLKLGDVLLLIGVSLLIGTLFIQEWDIPVKMNPEDEHSKEHRNPSQEMSLQSLL